MEKYVDIIVFLALVILPTLAISQLCLLLLKLMFQATIVYGG